VVEHLARRLLLATVDEMSWDEWRWWWGNREQMLRERSEELAAEAASQAAAQRRLASQLSKLEGFARATGDPDGRRL
jgi:hypothetical protein